MKNMTLSKIEDILRSGNFDKLVGVREDDVFEAKPPRPYEIDTKDGTKRIKAISELASDIASMANKKGGYIVCGLDTTPVHAARTDEVTSVLPFPKENFYSEEQVNGILNSKIIHPRLRVKVSWYARKDDSSRGLGVIYIPKQDENRKRFIVQVVQTEGRVHKNFVGIPTRQGHDTFWASAQDIYSLSKKRPTTLQESHQRLSEAIQGVSEQVQQIASAIQSVAATKGGPKEDHLMTKIKELRGEND